MPRVCRAAGLFALAALSLVAVGRPGRAAPQAQIDAAIEKGAKFLAGWVGQRPPGKGGAVAGGGGEAGQYGIGPHALVGIALIEARDAGKAQGVDPAIQTIATAVRDAAPRLPPGHQTYQLCLCLMFLDRLADPDDVPLIQVLAAQLLIGQTARGGWDYTSVENTAMDDALANGLKARNLRPGCFDADGNPQLHPAVAQYLQKLAPQAQKRPADDNSNTQFGILAVWTARKHGVPVDGALDRIAQRFAGAQKKDGGWGYVEAAVDTGRGSTAPMTCAGLLGLATWVARREEQWAAAQSRKTKPADATKEKKGDEPFFGAAKPKKQERRPPEDNDGRVAAGYAFLGQAIQTGALTNGDLYFLWSLERVGVIFGWDKIGQVDWHAVGCDYLIPRQKPEGDWTLGAYGTEVMTSFAVLFLLKANLATDMTGKIKGAGEATLIAPGAKPLAPAPGGGGSRPRPSGGAAQAPPTEAPLPDLKLAPTDEASRLAVTIADKEGEEFDAAINQLKEAKGASYTATLVQVIIRVDGDRLRRSREALAERLTRMTAKSLRTMMADQHPELRRGAVLAAAMKDDKDHVPDLIARIALDDEDLVIRAARVGLLNLTGSKEDLGPADGAEKAERKAAAEAWKAYWEKNKKQ